MDGAAARVATRPSAGPSRRCAPPGWRRARPTPHPAAPCHSPGRRFARPALRPGPLPPGRLPPGLRPLGGFGVGGFLLLLALFDALLGLLAGLRLLRIEPCLALQHAGLVEEAEHAVGRLRALREPMLDALKVELDALGVLRGEEGIVGPDLLDEAAVARRALVGDDDPVEGPLLGAAPRQSDLHCHCSVPFERN